MNATDFPRKEEVLISDLSPAQRSIYPNSLMMSHSLYVYLEVQSTVAAPTGWILRGEVIAKYQGQVVSSFPCSIGEFTGLAGVNESVTSLFNGGGYPVGDSLFLQLAQPFTNGNATAVIQPFRFEAEIDELVLKTEFRNPIPNTITGYRYYIGCVSTP